MTVAVGMVAILGKSRSFPLISVYLSRAGSRWREQNGGGAGEFGGDIGGFGGQVGGFGGRRLGVRCLDVDIGMAREMGGGMDLGYWLTW